MRTIRIFLGLLAATVALATAGTAAAEDVYTCPVEDVIGFRKMEEGVNRRQQVRLGHGRRYDATR